MSSITRESKFFFRAVREERAPVWLRKYRSLQHARMGYANRVVIDILPQVIYLLHKTNKGLTTGGVGQPPCHGDLLYFAIGPLVIFTVGFIVMLCAHERYSSLLDKRISK